MVTDPSTTKALAAWHASELARRLDLRQVVLEGDTLEIVNILKLDGTWLGNYDSVIQDAKSILGSCQIWRVSHAYREGNGVAHNLAKLALSLGQNVLWTENFPDCIWDLVLVEQALV